MPPRVLPAFASSSTGLSDDLTIPAQETFRSLLAPWAELDGVGADGDGRDPLLVVGAVDLLSGRFRAGSQRQDEGVVVAGEEAVALTGLRPSPTRRVVVALVGGLQPGGDRVPKDR